MWQSLLIVLPLLVRIANLLLDKNGATEEEKRKVAELIAGSKDDASTSIRIKDEFRDLRARLKARRNEA